MPSRTEGTGGDPTLVTVQQGLSFKSNVNLDAGGMGQDHVHWAEEMGSACMRIGSRMFKEKEANQQSPTSSDGSWVDPSYNNDVDLEQSKEEARMEEDIETGEDQGPFLARTRGRPAADIQYEGEESIEAVSSSVKTGERNEGDVQIDKKIEEEDEVLSCEEEVLQVMANRIRKRRNKETKKSLKVLFPKFQKAAPNLVQVRESRSTMRRTGCMATAGRSCELQINLCLEDPIFKATEVWNWGKKLGVTSAGEEEVVIKKLAELEDAQLRTGFAREKEADGDRGNNNKSAGSKLDKFVKQLL